MKSQPMKTYYIRHSSTLDICNDTMNRLIAEHRIAIHYPHHKDKAWIKGDNGSLDPETYKKTGKSAMYRLKTLLTEGGYVFGYYRGYNKCIIGKVNPKKEGKIEILEGKYGSKKHPTRTAILKTIKLDKWIELEANQSILFQSVQPRQGTFVQWHAIKHRIEYLVDNKKAKKDWEYLLPAEQEVMCAEFLRSKAAARNRLPTIESLKLPVGRTLKDIDIVGNGTNGEEIIVQVTHKAEKHKVEALKSYAKSENVVAIMFWGGKQKGRIDNIHYMNLKEVFKAWCEDTPEGVKWLERIP